MNLIDQVAYAVAKGHITNETIAEKLNIPVAFVNHVEQAIESGEYQFN